MRNGLRCEGRMRLKRRRTEARCPCKTPSSAHPALCDCLQRQRKLPSPAGGANGLREMVPLRPSSAAQRFPGEGRDLRKSPPGSTGKGTVPLARFYLRSTATSAMWKLAWLPTCVGMTV